MKSYRLRTLVTALGATALAATAAPGAAFEWQVVVNNGDLMPSDICDPSDPPDPPGPTCRHFNSYNQPSVNIDQLVVMRARSKGGGGGDGGGGEGGGGESGGHGNQPVHGIYTRDMAIGSPVVKILDRNTEVPQPNNINIPPSNPLLTTFVETPSFPRIDMWSDTMATRGNHQPVWKVLNEAGEILEQLGTTGIYTNPFGPLITGASKLGVVPELSFFEVPEAPGIPFDVFPGAPAVTDGTTIVFKGNWSVVVGMDENDEPITEGKTGVYYRDLTADPIPSSEGDLEPAGGTNPVVLIANNADTLIPGTDTVFGSTAPPSAADRKVVFAGFDNEEDPTLGGIYLAPLAGTAPPLTTLVSIGGQVPNEKKGILFDRLGEGVSFDGRFVAFWGAWGSETDYKTLILQCREDGNADRVAFCNEQYPEGYETTVPVHQGIFVVDTWLPAANPSRIRVVAKAPADFDDFVYWNFSGLVPGTGESDEDGEPARWRSASFVAVSGLVDGSLTDATFHAAFKARTGDVGGGAYVDPVDGIYLNNGPGRGKIVAVVETGMEGTLIDPEAVYLDEETGETMVLPVTEMGIERDGFRGSTLAINVSMGTEEAGWAGVYLTVVPK
jgi:hypothetical protein